MNDPNQPPPRAGRRPRILFLAEAVTLAHAARPVVLAQCLDPADYEVTLAVDPRYNRLLGDLPFPVRPIRSITSDRFLQALAHGSPLYDAQTLREYVDEDARVIKEVNPDVIVGDFRLSLAVSARLAGKLYMATSNAYWSPYARQHYPVPDLSFTRILGVTLGQWVFTAVRPLAFALHTLPLNRVRRESGLSHLGYDLRRVYTEADYTVYADTPELIPTYDLPANHRYLGPVLWSPPVKPPGWWDCLPASDPVVYVTLGSSGRSDLLAVVLRALVDLPITVMAATAGRTQVGDVPPNAFLAEFLPGQEAAARARLVICNGGSPSTHQALAVGTPVLGIPSNLDQYLNMQAVCRCGAGVVLRAGKTNAPAVRAAVTNMLAQSDYRTAANAVARVFARYPSTTRFKELLDELLQPVREGGR
jgi:UDP:flavonoid glycosyltransferase YjiC (YdhE family)